MDSSFHLKTNPGVGKILYRMEWVGCLMDGYRWVDG